MIIRISIFLLCLTITIIGFILSPTVTLVVLGTLVVVFIACEFPYRIIVSIFRKIQDAKYASIVLPFQHRYITVFKDDKEVDVDIRHKLHELDHISYYKEKGALVGSIIHLAYLIKYGYWNNPIEVRARKAAGQE